MRIDVKKILGSLSVGYIHPFRGVYIPIPMYLVLTVQDG
jgi:hypothetical protein